MSPPRDPNGTITFPALEYTAPGVHHYNIRELTPPAEGWSYNETEIPVTVTVTQAVGGGLAASIDFEEEDPTFVNFYENQSAAAVVAGTEEAFNLSANARVGFGLFNRSGHMIYSTVGKLGDFSFPALEFSRPGVYAYFVRGLVCYRRRWNPVGERCPVLVHVEKIDCALHSSVEYPEGAPAFLWRCCGGKGSCFPDCRFLCTPPNSPECPPPDPCAPVPIEPPNPGHPVPIDPPTPLPIDPSYPKPILPPDPMPIAPPDPGKPTPPDDAHCGLVEFPELTFTEPGDYEYILRELTPSGDGWITDDRSYRAIIHVTDDGHGNLSAEAEFPDGAPIFVDIYSSSPAHAQLTVHKIAVGAELTPGQFEFGLFDENGTLVAISTNGPESCGG